MMKSIGISCVLAMLATTSTSAQNTNYTMTLSGSDGAPGGIALVTVTLDHQSSNLVAGWSVGVCHDPGVSLRELSPGTTAMTANQGTPPDFLMAIPFGDEGWTGGALISFFGNDYLSPGMGYELHIAQYDLGQEGQFPVWLCDLGNIQTKVVEAGSVTHVPMMVDTEVSAVFGASSSFVRGDCNTDGNVGLNDALSLLGFLFLSGALDDCVEACNMNDDSSLGIPDVLSLMSFLFGNGLPLPAPFPQCGTDPIGDCSVPTCL